MKDKRIKYNDQKTRNLHLVEVRYYGPTNSRGSRLRLSSARFEESVWISYDYDLTNVTDMAANWLHFHGFRIVGFCETRAGYGVLTDTHAPLRAAREFAKRSRRAILIHSADSHVNTETFKLEHTFESA